MRVSVAAVALLVIVVIRLRRPTSDVRKHHSQFANVRHQSIDGVKIRSPPPATARDYLPGNHRPFGIRLCLAIRSVTFTFEVFSVPIKTLWYKRWIPETHYINIDNKLLRRYSRSNCLSIWLMAILVSLVCHSLIRIGVAAFPFNRSAVVDTCARLRMIS